MNIPTKQLKEMCVVVYEPRTEIWNTEIIQKRIFSSKLKLADISPIHKKLETILTTNDRPVSQLPVS